MKENVQKQWRRHLCCGRFRLADNSGKNNSQLPSLDAAVVHKSPGEQLAVLFLIQCKPEMWKNRLIIDCHFTSVLTIAKGLLRYHFIKIFKSSLSVFHWRQLVNFVVLWEWFWKALWTLKKKKKKLRSRIQTLSLRRQSYSFSPTLQYVDWVVWTVKLT